MDFHIGDIVIHSTYGMGEVVHIEEKVVHDSIANCYVVRTNDLTIWIPINDLHQNSLRTPTSPDEFVRLFSILTGPGEDLPEDRVLRKDQLLANMKNGKLASICHIVRDLTLWKQTKKLNDRRNPSLSGRRIPYSRNGFIR